MRSALGLPVRGRGRAEGEREEEGVRVGLSALEFLVLAVELAVLLLVIRFFGFEVERGLVHATPILFAGFAIHAWLPLSWRLPFFVLLTGALIVVLLGPLNGSVLIALALGLVGLCHLPVPMWARVSTILAVAAVLAAMHTGWAATGWSVAVVPVLASIFMFRLMLYLYDLSTQRSAATPWQRLGYFFLVPNPFFPLFPVVDYATYLRTYYARDAAEIYQKGMGWILRGLTHLVLYRLVYHSLPAVDEGMGGLPGLLVVAAMTYGLYLRVSGLFHMIAGILCLFGLDLPETNHRYFLASSFTDFWRRINIYWKDFLMTVVFYPVVNRVRRLGLDLATGMALAAVVTLLASWALHSYQWFWLWGEFPVTLVDAFFWGTLAVCVAANTVWETRRGRRRRSGQGTWSWSAAAGLSLRTVAVFLFISNLWYLWDLASFAEWGARARAATVSSPGQLASVAAALAVLVAGGTAVQWVEAREWRVRRSPRPVFGRAALATTLAAAALAVVAQPRVHEALGARVSDLARMARSGGLNQQDLVRRERGYYETLTRASRFTSPLALEGRDPRWVDFHESDAVWPQPDGRIWIFRPDFETEFKLARLTTNGWGMRDREYPVQAAPGTFRMALTGGSISAGSGVADEEVFEARVEERLNGEHAGGAFERYEILNFATPGWSLTQVLHDLEPRVFRFRPDAVLYVAHPDEEIRAGRQLARVARERVEITDPFVAGILRRANVRPGTVEAIATERIMPLRREFLEGGYLRLAEAIRAGGAVPVWVFVPRLEIPVSGPEMEDLAALARAAGFVVLTVEDAYRGADATELMIAPWDEHPDAEGHARIAAGLYRELVERSDEIGLGIAAPAAAR